MLFYVGDLRRKWSALRVRLRVLDVDSPRHLTLFADRDVADSCCCTCWQSSFSGYWPLAACKSRPLKTFGDAGETHAARPQPLSSTSMSLTRSVFRVMQGQRSDNPNHLKAWQCSRRLRYRSSAEASALISPQLLTNLLHT